ncbi:23S rRNA pseudouridine synthase F, partial [Shewanella sp. A25]|nr:23S rRNA pseudouridine synthase F [Shewanella shenzhenensis]
SNDGALTQRLMHPDFAHDKRYHVTVDKPLSHEFLKTMARGLDYGAGLTRPCRMQQLAEQQFCITLTEGKKRQIRRM